MKKWDKDIVKVVNVKVFQVELLPFSPTPKKIMFFFLYMLLQDVSDDEEVISDIYYKKPVGNVRLVWGL